MCLYSLRSLQQIRIQRNLSVSSTARSISNIIRNKLPTLPELPPYQKSNNSFALNLRLTKTDWLQKLLGINLEVIQPIAMHGEVNDQQKIIDLTASLPKFKYNGTTYESFVRMNTPNDTLTTDIHLKRINNKDNDFLWYIHAKAVDNQLHSSISWDNQSKNIFKGKLVSDANFYKTEKGQPAAHIKILPSDILVGDTVWNIKPADISYYANHLDISNLSVQHKKQHIIINGTATKNKEDNIQVDLNDVDVKYILNLVNFHSVDFSGQASGNASISSVFSDPQAEANLSVRNFRFQDGRMGTLEANVNYWNEEGQINIDAYTHDEGMKNTFIKGYVSPKHNSIDLNIDAEGTRLEFIEDFCGSFMKNVEATVAGNVRVYGPLNNINLTGKVVANGPVTISSLNTTYEMINDTVLIVPDHIIFQRDTVYDRNSNIGILSGSVDHKHLTNFKFYLNIEAKNLPVHEVATIIISHILLGNEPWFYITIHPFAFKFPIHIHGALQSLASLFFFLAGEVAAAAMPTCSSARGCTSIPIRGASDCSLFPAAVVCRCLFCQCVFSYGQM